jgi:hypothetical protein
MMKRNFSLLKISFCLFLIIGLMTSSMADITEGLVGYWPLDDSVKDEVGKHDGKLEGGAKFVKDADRGQVLEVDGAIGPKGGKAIVPHADDLSFAIKDSYSLSVWVKAIALPGHWAGIVNKSRDQAPHYGLWLDGSNRWCFGGGNIFGSTPKAKQWYHVVLVQDAKGKERLSYVDNQIDIKGGSPIESSGPGDLWMGGANCCGFGEQFHGCIDDVAIFNRALSEKEIPDAGEIVQILPVQLKGKLTTTWAKIRQSPANLRRQE